MGQDIQCNNVNFPGRAAASAVRLGSHAARGDYGGCDSARVARPGSHAARGGRGGRSSASTMRVVIIARLARCADAALCAASGLIMKVSRRRGQYTLLKCSCYSEVIIIIIKRRSGINPIPPTVIIIIIIKGHSLRRACLQPA